MSELLGLIKTEIDKPCISSDKRRFADIKAEDILKLLSGWKSPKEVEEIKVRGLEAGKVLEREKIISEIEAIDKRHTISFVLEALKDKP